MDAPGQRALQIFMPGIAGRNLWSDGTAKAAVVDIAPGAVWDGVEVHEPGPEEVYVVSGTLNDGVRDYPAGSSSTTPRVRHTSHSRAPVAGCSSSTRRAEEQP